MGESREARDIKKARDKDIHKGTAAGFRELQANQPAEKYLGPEEMKEIWKNLEEAGIKSSRPPESSKSS